MSTGRVFLSRLAGVGVFDPNGDQIGKARDSVATLGIGNQPARVLGLVVEIQHRHRFEPDAVVLATASVNLKRFERRQHELLVIAELLDRYVTLIADGRPARIVDAGMERTRGQEWIITRLAVQISGGRLRGRRGEMFQVVWDEVNGLSLSSSSQGTQTLLSVLAGLRPADVASALKEMPAGRRRDVATALDDERLADVLQEMSDEDQIALLGSLPDERAADVLEEMDDDDAADLLSEMPAYEQERLLTLMEPEEAAPVRRLMSYGDYTAGGLMTSDALALVRNPDLTPALASQVYVVRPPQATPTGRYLGTAHLQRLLREPPSALVSGAVETDPDPLTPHATLSDVTRYLATYNLLAAAVVDDDDRLLGAVSVDDVVDHLLPEDWREAEPTGIRVTHGALRGDVPGGRHG